MTFYVRTGDRPFLSTTCGNHVTFFFRSFERTVSFLSSVGRISSASAFETADCQRTFRLILKRIQKIVPIDTSWQRLFRSILSVLVKAIT